MGWCDSMPLHGRGWQRDPPTCQGSQLHPEPPAGTEEESTAQPAAKLTALYGLPDEAARCHQTQTNRKKLPTLRRCMAAQMRRPDAMKASTRPRQPTMVQASHLRRKGSRMPGCVHSAGAQLLWQRQRQHWPGAAQAGARVGWLFRRAGGLPWIALAVPLHSSLYILQLSALTCCMPCPSGRSSCGSRAGKVPPC